MKSCQDFTILLSEYLDDELSEVQRREVDEHVGCCPDCAQQLDSFARLNERIMSEFPMSAGFRSRVQERWSQLADGNWAASTPVTQPDPTWHSWVWQMLAVAAAVAIFAGLTQVTRRGAPPIDILAEDNGSEGLNLVEPLASLHRTSMRQEKTQQLLCESLEWELHPCD